MTEFVWVITREDYEGTRAEAHAVATSQKAAVAYIKREFGPPLNYHWADLVQPNANCEKYELDPIYEAVNHALYPCREPYTITRMAIQEGT